MTTTRWLLFTIGTPTSYYHQACWAILRILSQAEPGDEILVITDHPERYDLFRGRIRLHVIDDRLLSAWRGPEDFFWRCQLEAMHLGTESLGGSPPDHLIYVDSDTYLLADVTPLRAGLHQGQVFMHQHEYDLGEARRSSDRRLAWSYLGRTFAGITIEGTSAMWNCGVTAVSTADFSVFTQALALCDAMGAAGISSIYLNQLALSLAMQATGRLASAEPWFLHYWGNKDAWNGFIRDRLAEAYLRGMSLDQLIVDVAQERITLAADARPHGIRKILLRLAGNKVV